MVFEFSDQIWLFRSHEAGSVDKKNIIHVTNTILLHIPTALYDLAIPISRQRMKDC